VKAVSQEVYALPRRGSLPYPPDVVGKEIEVKATISKGNRDLQGVIMAQGGKDAGYGFFIQEGKLNMVVKQGGKTYKAVSSQPLPEKFDFVGRLAANGRMTLEVDGKPVGQAKAPALFTQALTQGVRAGQDLNTEDKMGAYEGQFALIGNMQHATLELKKPAKAAASQLKAKTATGKGKTAAPAATAVTINMKVVEHLMQFDKKLVTIQAGQKVTLNLENPDGMQHNLVIIKPGTLQQVGAAADALARDPNGAEKNYVPRMPEVLWATRLLGTGESATLEFTAPSQPGDYVFVCTFPGHWRGMNGILRVTK
jgi:azurin